LFCYSLNPLYHYLVSPAETDGLSAAASVLAVISLAMQLGGAARDLVSFLDTISDAPKEVTRLRDLLNLIYASSAGIRNALEHQQRLQADPHQLIPGAENVRDALLDCQSKLRLISELLDKVGDARRGQALIRRSWPRFRLAMKKEDVLEFERQLGLSLQILNISLTTTFM
jgi:hypothetical protein